MGGRTAIIHSLLPQYCERLLDVGCGPIGPEYGYAKLAERVTCVDWNLRLNGSVPGNVECLEGDFTALQLPSATFDAIVASDVFEHVAIEQEHCFIETCISTLRPGGTLILSVPHAGSFAALDPYNVKPMLHRALARAGLYHQTHNGFCDIRKGHKHYTVAELASLFAPLEIEQVVYFGYLVDPLKTCAVALLRNRWRVPQWLENARNRELERDYGPRSANVVVRLRKPQA